MLRLLTQQSLSHVSLDAFLPSLLLHQGFLFPQEDPVDHLLLVVPRDLWVQVGLVGPGREREDRFKTHFLEQRLCQ